MIFFPLVVWVIGWPISVRLCDFLDHLTTGYLPDKSDVAVAGGVWFWGSLMLFVVGCVTAKAKP